MKKHCHVNEFISCCQHIKHNYAHAFNSFTREKIHKSFNVVAALIPPLISVVVLGTGWNFVTHCKKKMEG